MTSGPWTLLALLVPIATIVSGCAVQRAVVANDAQEKMVGLTKEQVLAKAGPLIKM